MVPSVTMKGTTLVALIIRPLASPQRQPVSNMSINAFRVGSPAFRLRAKAVPDSVRAVPAERSMPPEMMINVIPKAGTAIKAALLLMTRRFRADMK